MPEQPPVRSPVPQDTRAAEAASPAPIPPGPLPPDPPAPEPLPEPGQPAPGTPPGPFPGPLPPGPVKPDPVTEAGEESFPASDPPSYSPTTASAPEGRGGRREGFWHRLSRRLGLAA